MTTGMSGTPMAARSSSRARSGVMTSATLAQGGDAVGQQAMAVHADDEEVADPPAASVSCDDVLGPHGPVRPRVEIVDGDSDARSVLLQGPALGAVAETSPELLGTGPEYRLESVLVDEQPHGRAELVHSGLRFGK
jgi:hypothetical protein